MPTRKGGRKPPQMAQTEPVPKPADKEPVAAAVSEPTPAPAKQAAPTKRVPLASQVRE